MLNLSGKSLFVYILTICLSLIFFYNCTYDVKIEITKPKNIEAYIFRTYNKNSDFTWKIISTINTNIINDTIDDTIDEDYAKYKISRVLSYMSQVPDYQIDEVYISFWQKIFGGTKTIYLNLP